MINISRFLQKFDLIMNQTQELLIFFNEKGHVTDCNKQALKELGYSNDIINLPICEIFKKAFYNEDRKIKLDPKFKIQSEETIVYRKNQTCFPVELKVLFGGKGSMYLGLCIAVNISERKEMEREIRRLEEDLINQGQLLTDLFANVTHELRTPINGIMGFSNNLLETQLNPEQREDLKIIKKCCENMNAIIGDILDFSKITNNKLSLEHRDFNFREFIHQIIEVNSVQLNDKGLKLMLDISGEIPEVVIGDELRLSQIIHNLFSNAIKFTLAGHIGLKVTKVSQTDNDLELFFMVIDTGIGISAEDRDKLFTSFSQVDSSISRRFGGTGLGLSISKRLVEAMNGTIQVESEKNKGSVFSFSVHLGLPSDKEVLSERVDTRKKWAEMPSNSRSEAARTYDKSNQTEFDYIRMRLKENHSMDSKETVIQEPIHQILKELTEIIEKLFICIAIENWELAEEMVFSIKQRIPQEYVTLSKGVFRLLLALRKEDEEQSLVLLRNLKECIEKEA
jgi:PAS domain S-box-containing protein